MSSSMPFPPFSYHPDPRGTGVIVESDADCLACGQFREYIYRGPVYSGHREELSDALCPLRIADGTAGWSPAGVEEFLDGLDKDGDHTAYLFACRHCGVHLAYSDSA